MIDPNNLNPPSTPINIPFSLGYGFHKLSLDDFEVRHFPADGDKKGAFLVNLDLRGESIPNFKGFDDKDYQTVRLKPHFGFMVENFEGIKAMFAEANQIKVDNPEYNDGKIAKELRERHPNKTESGDVRSAYEGFLTLAYIARAFGVGEQIKGIQGKDQHDYLSQYLEVLKASGKYAWFAITETDYVDKDGKVRTNKGINYNTINSLEEVAEVVYQKEGNLYDVQLANGRSWTYKPGKYTYHKIAQAATPTVTNDPLATPSTDTVPPPMVEDDLPF